MSVAVLHSVWDLARELWTTHHICSPVIELTTWAQSCKVVALNVLHLKIWARGVRWEKTTSLSLLFFMLFVEDEHL